MSRHGQFPIGVAEMHRPGPSSKFRIEFLELLPSFGFPDPDSAGLPAAAGRQPTPVVAEIDHLAAFSIFKWQFLNKLARNGILDPDVLVLSRGRQVSTVGRVIHACGPPLVSEQSRSLGKFV